MSNTEKQNPWKISLKSSAYPWSLSKDKRANWVKSGWKYHWLINKKSTTSIEKRDLWHLGQAWEDFKGSVKSFKAMSRSRTTRKKWRNKRHLGFQRRQTIPNGSAFFSARRRSCRVTHNNTGQRANLWLWTPVVCIWGLSRAWERGSLQGPKAPTHSQMSSTEEGERTGAKEGRRRQNMFYSGGELGSGTLERPGLDTVTPSSTTYIPRQFLRENTCDNAATLLTSICNVPFPLPSPCFHQSTACSIQKTWMFFPWLCYLISLGPNMQLASSWINLRGWLSNSRWTKCTSYEQCCYFWGFAWRSGNLKLSQNPDSPLELLKHWLLFRCTCEPLQCF